MAKKMNKHEKMNSCAHYTYVDDFMDKCSILGEFPCDAPTDCPLWNECEDCTYYKAKEGGAK